MQKTPGVLSVVQEQFTPKAGMDRTTSVSQNAAGKRIRGAWKGRRHGGKYQTLVRPRIFQIREPHVLSAVLRPAFGRVGSAPSTGV